MQLCTFHGMYRSGTQHKRVPLAYVLMSRRQTYKLRKGPLIACGKIHFWFLKSNLAERLYSFPWRCSHIWLFFIGLNSFQTIVKLDLYHNTLKIRLSLLCKEVMIPHFLPKNKIVYSLERFATTVSMYVILLLQADWKLSEKWFIYVTYKWLNFSTRPIAIWC